MKNIIYQSNDDNNENNYYLDNFAAIKKDLNLIKLDATILNSEDIHAKLYCGLDSQNFYLYIHVSEPFFTAKYSIMSDYVLKNHFTEKCHYIR